jgi:molecular chaperone GrpE
MLALILFVVRPVKMLWQAQGYSQYLEARGKVENTRGRSVIERLRKFLTQVFAFRDFTVGCPPPLSMSALQVLRACLGSHVRHTMTQSVARPAVASTRLQGTRSYASEKGKEKETNTDEPKDNATAENASAPPKNEADDLAAKLQAKQDEVVELTVGFSLLSLYQVYKFLVPDQGRLRYAQADFINLQRIAAREKEQTRDFSISRFASDLLETVDTLSMALRAAPRSPPTQNSSSSETPPPYFQPSSQSSDALLQGVEATHRLLLQTLAKYGVNPFDPTGDKFDPNRHEALYSVPFPNKEPGEVLECQKLGYMIKDRVLRAAQVGVVADSPVEQRHDAES